MRRNRVMSAKEYEHFRSFLREGLSHYKIGARAAGAQLRRKRRPQDLLAQRRNILTTWFPLAEAGYRTKKQRGRLIENALCRPTKYETAQLALYALMHSAAAQRWRQENPVIDSWLQRKDKLAENHIWARDPEPAIETPQSVPAAILPTAIHSMAEVIVERIYNLIYITESEKAAVVS